MCPTRLPKVRRLPNSTFIAQAGLVATSQALRSDRRGGIDRPLRAIAPALPEQRQIQREHQRRALRRDRPLDERLIEAAIAHQVLLKPERPAGGRAHVLDRADRHGAQAERDAERRGGPRAEDFPVGVEQSGEPGRRDGERHRDLGAEHRGRERSRGNVHHDALAESSGRRDPPRWRAACAPDKSRRRRNRRWPAVCAAGPTCADHRCIESSSRRPSGGDDRPLAAGPQRAVPQEHARLRKPAGQAETN